jgi:hypothetical protein
LATDAGINQHLASTLGCSMEMTEAKPDVANALPRLKRLFRGHQFAHSFTANNDGENNVARDAQKTVAAGSCAIAIRTRLESAGKICGRS